MYNDRLSVEIFSIDLITIAVITFQTPINKWKN